MSSKFFSPFLILFFVSTLAVASQAHEVRPAYLGLEEIDQTHLNPPWPMTEGNTFRVVWKQPILNDKRLRIDPIFPSDCVTTVAVTSEVVPGALIRNWQFRCAPNAFEREPITIQGLSKTLTDVWVNVSLLNGRNISTVLRPAKPSFWLNNNRGAQLSRYLALGVRHLLSGPDHILFILGLFFFVRNFSTLIKTITAFTVAHSITLAASSFKLVHLSQAPVEAAIALSILFLAVEASRPNRKETLTARMPWLVAFVFGLLHGFGFASVLSDIGLPKGAAALALMLFNFGVEIGQALVIGAMFLFLYVTSRWASRVPTWAVKSPVIAMGALSFYWLLKRLVPIFES